MRVQNFGSLGKGLRMSRIWTGIKLGVGAAVMAALAWVWIYDSKLAAFALACVAGLAAGAMNAIEDYDG